MSVMHLTAENFNENIGSGRVLVDFWASWCGPCQMLGPLIEELAEEYKGRATIAKVDIDNEKKLAQRYGVMSIPTVILFEDGVEKNRFVGVQPKAVYTADL